MRETEWQEPVFEAFKLFERGGVQVGVIGQAFPFTPIANPRWLVPEWSFGIQEDLVREHVQAARAAGAQLVVLLSHNGFDVDRKMAGRVEGIDVILSGHTHDAMPRPDVVGKTLIVASGCNGKFVSRLDLDVRAGRIAGWRHKLIPVFADAIAPGIVLAQAAAAGRLRVLARNSAVVAVNLWHVRQVGVEHATETGRACRSVDRPLPFAVPVFAATLFVLYVSVRGGHL